MAESMNKDSQRWSIDHYRKANTVAKNVVTQATECPDHHEGNGFHPFKL